MDAVYSRRCQSNRAARGRNASRGTVIPTGGSARRQRPGLALLVERVWVSDEVKCEKFEEEKRKM